MTADERFEPIETNLEKVTLSQLRTQDSIGGLVESIGRYVDAGEARLKRLEENLDGLIRAITAEHSNGKSRQRATPWKNLTASPLWDRPSWATAFHSSTASPCRG